MEKIQEFEALFDHMPQYKIIRCKLCQYAVVPQQIQRHVKDHHPQTPKETRKTIAEVCDTLPDVARVRDEVVYPKPGGEPVKGFPIYENALVCMSEEDGEFGERCGYACTAIQKMQEHCKAKHGWENTQKRGGNSHVRVKHTANRLWKEGERCQRIFEYRQWRRMFVVEGRVETQAEGEKMGANEAKRLIQRATAIIDAAGEEEDSSRDHFVADPWMEMTGCHRHLRGFDHVKLLQHIRPAIGEVEAEGDKDGGQQEGAEVQGEVEVPGLAEACRATKRIVQRAFVTCTPERIPRAVLQQVCRTETGGSVKDLRTFYSQQNVSTIRKYMEVWVEMLRYIWRTSTQKKRPRYRLTVKQEMRLQQLQQSVAKDDDGTGRRKTGHREKTARRERIEAASLSFWIAMFDHELKEHEFESGVISALAVIRIMRPKGGYTAAINYTPRRA